MLRAYVNYQQDNWDEHLPAAEFAYNNSKQGSTNYTPFELDCGQTPETPPTLATNQDTKVASAHEFLEQWENMIKIAKDNLTLAQERQTKYANKGRRHEEFNKGDQVMLSTKYFISPIDKQRPTKKFTSKYVGPYKVLEKLSTTAYKLELPASMKMHPVFHVSLIKPYKGNPAEFNRQTPPPPEVIIGSNDEEYEVEAILNKRIIRKKPQYLIKWTGYPLYDSTWEPLENLTNAKEMVKDFERNN